MANLQLNHIYKVYPNGVKAVNDFTMNIDDKEFIVFVGPSGCGKSTTLRMIAGLEEISAGELKIGGVVVNDMEPKDRDIAMVFQNYALYPHMTVYNNMAFALRQRKTPKDEIDRRVKEAAEILGISNYLDRKPKAMSGGQRQRVALGRAIVREPKVFLLDEPLSNLDAKLRTTMRAEISKLHHRLQTTFIYVTHDQIEAMTMGTRIVVMKEGFVQQIDTPRNLYNYPTNKFVAEFIGTPQMNLYKGTALKSGAKVQIALDGTDIVWNVPFKKFVKADRAFLDGQKKLIFGIRCEHVSMDSKKYPFKANCIVTNIEELGNDSQVYADFNTNEDSLITENSKTKIIIKAPAGCGYNIGDKAEVSFDLDFLNVFDAATENTIMPRIPQSVSVPVTVAGSTASVLTGEVVLPPAMSLEDGEYSAVIPTEAFKLGGDIVAEVIGDEDVNGQRLLTLNAGDSILFACVDKDEDIGKEVKVGFDVKKATFTKDGKVVLNPLNERNVLSGYIRKTKLKQKDSKGNKYTFTLEIEGIPFNCPKEMATRIISGGGQDVFKRPLEFVFSPEDVRYSDTGIAVVNMGTLDYGTEKYDKLLCGDKEIVNYLYDDENKSDFISLDMKKVSVWDAQNNIRLA